MTEPTKQVMRITGVGYRDRRSFGCMGRSRNRWRHQVAPRFSRRIITRSDSGRLSSVW
jgi:hypothetical protein